MMSARSGRLLVLVLASNLWQVKGFHIANGFARPLRTIAPAMQIGSSNNKQPLDTVHYFNVGHDAKNDKPVQMALTQVSDEKRAVLAYWRFMYEHERGNDPDQVARAQMELRAQMAATLLYVYVRQ